MISNQSCTKPVLIEKNNKTVGEILALLMRGFNTDLNSKRISSPDLAVPLSANIQPDLAHLEALISI